MKKQKGIGKMHNTYVRIKNATSGITLIALVVTIIVLLILAGVSIATLTGDNGILTRASRVKETQRGAEVEEFVSLTINENQIASYWDNIKKNKTDVVNELYAEGKLTEEEKNKLLGLNGETEVDVITIGGIEIDFSVLEKEPPEELPPEIVPPELDDPNTTERTYYGNLDTGIITDTMPETPTNRDVYLKGDYVYMYLAGNEGWTAFLATADQGIQSYVPDYPIVDRNQTSYGEILTEICGKPIVALYETFANCTNLTTAPYVSNNVKYMTRTFYNCTSLTGELRIDTFPDGGCEDCFGNVDFAAQNLTLTGIAKIGLVFLGKTGLNYTYEIPEPLPSGGYYFNLDTGIVYEEELPEYPSEHDIYMQGDYVYVYLEDDDGWTVELVTENIMYLLDIYPDYPVADENQTSYDEILTEINGAPIVALNRTFSDCKNLITAPEIPSTVIKMPNTFENCTSLTEKPTIPSGVITEESDIFEGCTQFGY